MRESNMFEGVYNEMRSRPFVVLAVLCASCITRSTQAADWPMFRGPGGRSIGEAVDLPLEWAVDVGQNIAWQVDLPGRGVSSPIVVDGKVYLTASSGPNRNHLHILAFESQSGEKLWHRKFWATGRTLCHETSAVAAPTPASDGTRVFAYFSSNDIVALDLEGNLLWMRGLALDYPGAGNDIGLSSSPAVVDDVVVVQCEAQGNSFVAALDTSDGSTRWDTKRPEKSNWSTPVAISQTIEGEEVEAVLLHSAESLGALRADSGEVLWELPLECDTISSSVFDTELFVPAGGLRVFDLSKKSSLLTGPIWSEPKLKSGSPSPVVVDGLVYVINSAGVLTCGSLESKQLLWRKRLGGSFWATPVAVGNYLYCINATGQSFVVDAASGGEIVSECEFGEDILASPAVADNALFVRSHHHLWKISK
ncbi:MAG: PQQ-binding-like beta-propeller repeat protein [Planctomycetales bacterium]|nr:PQQ-binding-like beta-propeller repeat protein [Planctomycetales bacterium]